MHESERIALIFINWRTGALTVNAARSALASTRDPARLRLIVVDNGSGDDSLAVLARDLPEAEVVALPANAGFAKAANAGLARVQAERIAFILNSDIEFRNDALTLLEAALLADPKAVLACPTLLRPDGSLQPAAVPEPRLFWELTSRSLPRHLLRLVPGQTQPVPGIVGPCMAVHLERARAGVGLLDERFFFFMEETDWCQRINAAGQHVLLVPAAEVMHMQGESANRRPTRARVQFYSSRYRYFRKHGGPVIVALLFAGLWLNLTISIVLQALAAGLTLGRSTHRDRLAVCGRLWLWHLLLCRPKWGFEP
jgi:N-acetylglucosaminyl-diphospho-decaprenol L-rhamnosyltransferase